MTTVTITQSDPKICLLLELLLRGSKRYRVTTEPSADLLLLDLRSLPEMDTVHREYPDSKIVVVSPSPARIYLKQILEAGAHGFWVMTPDGSGLTEAMDRAMAGEPAQQELPDLQLGQQDGQAFTDRELAILQELASGATDTEIAEVMHLSLRTIKGYIQSLRANTGFRNRTELAVQAVSSGLIVPKQTEKNIPNN